MPAGHVVYTEFTIKSKVHIDCDISITGIVTAIQIRHSGVVYEVSYMHNGTSYNQFIEAYRLTLARTN